MSGLSLQNLPGPDFSHVDVWLFDLDNTLYDASSGVFPQIDVNMRSFLMREFALGEDDARTYQKRLYRDYGTTLAGLMAEHDLDPARFLHHVHDIDLAELAPDPAVTLDEGPALPGGTVRSALRRWFAPLLWFLLLGPAGALLYRLVERAALADAGLLPVENAEGTRTLLRWLEKTPGC